MKLAIVKIKNKMKFHLGEDNLDQNCKVGKTYPVKCGDKLCNPQPEFDMVESCKKCKKWQ
ncbi:hypothetical protein BA195_06670 [Tenacibaculum soleae]|uniref:Uncharacterized protein n=1 Tax=Tenacibaculum soleae TaxID=447689 RepID=A0A1B9Y3G3_9FLAO|nr:hypothetical protein [Tenacibaculum soleae]OCK44354.1 hypothetical protein BA195_06670 [Tenacibaculum soleae]